MQFKRIFAAVLTMALLASSFVFAPAFAREGDYDQLHYTIPQTLNAPAIDGVMSEGEWDKAYHAVTNKENAMWYGSIGIDGLFQKGLIGDEENACTGWDYYIQWVQGGVEAEYGEGEGGLYFCVVGHDTTRFDPPKEGDALNGGVDVVQLAIDPFNTEHPADRFLFDFAPYSIGDTNRVDDWSGPAICYEHFKHYTDPSVNFNLQKAAVLTENDYTMEFFIPFFALVIGEELMSREVGTEIGLGFIFMDWVGESPYWFALDFGTGADFESALAYPDIYNKVKLGGIPAEANIDLGYTVADVGKEITASVKLSDSAKQIGGLTATLNYDNTILELVSTEAEILASSEIVPSVADQAELKIVETNYGGNNDAIRFTAMNFDETQTIADGTQIMKVKFKVKSGVVAADVFNLEIEAADKLANDISVKVTSSLVNNILKGDIDKNSKIELSDAMKAFQHVAKKLVLEDTAFDAADIDNNGKIELSDAMKIFQCVAKKITEEDLQNA